MQALVSCPRPKASAGPPGRTAYHGAAGPRHFGSRRFRILTLPTLRPYEMLRWLISSSGAAAIPVPAGTPLLVARQNFPRGRVSIYPRLLGTTRGLGDSSLASELNADD
jgi:hypothetical protein